MNSSNLTFPDLLALLSPVPPPYAKTHMPSLIEGIPDGILSLAAPIIAYWSYLTFFHILDVYELAEKYRIHPSEEEVLRNRVTLHEVVRDVIFQHIIQTLAGLVLFHFEPAQTTGYEMFEMWQWKHLEWTPAFVPNWVIYVAYTFGISGVKIGISLLIIDLWQYWLHRLMHTNKYLYRRFHSRHHRLYVPYAYGALYNDPVEGFLLDTLGAGLASMVTGLSPRESIVLFTFATMKTVDDHCGYRLPYDLFQTVFPNNLIYHDIHHQSWGIKHNFLQPFFTVWDKYLNTQYQFVQDYKLMQSSITLAKYKEFLAKKDYRKKNGVKVEEDDKKEQ